MVIVAGRRSTTIPAGRRARPGRLVPNSPRREIALASMRFWLGFPGAVVAKVAENDEHQPPRQISGLLHRNRGRAPWRPSSQLRSAGPCRGSSKPGGAHPGDRERARWHSGERAEEHRLHRLLTGGLGDFHGESRGGGRDRGERRAKAVTDASDRRTAPAICDRRQGCGVNATVAGEATAAQPTVIARLKIGPCLVMGVAQQGS
jgi:hypothetical protein